MSLPAHLQSTATGVDQSLSSWEEKGAWALGRWRHELDDIGHQNRVMSCRLEARVKTLEDQLNSRITNVTSQIVELGERLSTLARDGRDQAGKTSKLENEMIEHESRSKARSESWIASLESLGEDYGTIRNELANAQTRFHELLERMREEFSAALAEHAVTHGSELRVQVEKMQEHVETNGAKVQRAAEDHAHRRVQAHREDVDKVLTDISTNKIGTQEQALQSLRTSLDEVYQKLGEHGDRHENIHDLHHKRIVEEEETRTSLASMLRQYIDDQVGTTHTELKEHIFSETSEIHQEKKGIRGDLDLALSQLEILQAEIKNCRQDLMKDITTVREGSMKEALVLKEVIEHDVGRDAKIQRHAELIEQASADRVAERQFSEARLAELRAETMENQHAVRRSCQEWIVEAEKSELQAREALRTRFEEDTSQINVKISELQMGAEATRATQQENAQKADCRMDKNERELQDFMQRLSQACGGLAELKGDCGIFRNELSSLNTALVDCTKKSEFLIQEVGQRSKEQLDAVVKEMTELMSRSFERESVQAAEDAAKLKVELGRCQLQCQDLWSRTAKQETQVFDWKAQQTEALEKLQEAFRREIAEVHTVTTSATSSVEGLVRSYQERVTELLQFTNQEINSVRTLADDKLTAVKNQACDEGETLRELIRDRCEMLAEQVLGQKKYLDEALRSGARLEADVMDLKGQTAALAAARQEAAARGERREKELAQHWQSQLETATKRVETVLSTKLEQGRVACLDIVQQTGRQLQEIGEHCSSQLKEVRTFSDTRASEVHQQAEQRAKELEQIQERQMVALRTENATSRHQAQKDLNDLRHAVEGLSRQAADKYNRLEATAFEASRLEERVEGRLSNHESLLTQRFLESQQGAKESMERRLQTLEHNLHQQQLRVLDSGSIDANMKEIEGRLQGSLKAKLAEVDSQLKGFHEELRAQSSWTRSELRALEGPRSTRRD